MTWKDLHPFPSPSGDVRYELTAKIVSRRDVWTCAHGLAQVLWYVKHWSRMGYADIEVTVYVANDLLEPATLEVDEMQTGAFDAPVTHTQPEAVF